jgi:moderate conductance mechanosensitive channel
MDKFFKNVLESISEFFDSIGKNADKIFFGFIKIICVLLLARILIVLIRHIIKRILHRSKKIRPSSSMARKSETIESVSASAAKYAVYFFAAIAILDILGMGGTVSSLLATAGIGGIALAFGAQSFVKDVVAGFFLLLENQYSVGEYIETGDEKGTVEAITIRTTRIRRFTGEITTLPNGGISSVTNYSRGDHLAVIDIPAPYGSDIEKISKIMQDKGLEYMTCHDNILEEPHVLGITELGDNMVVRMILRVRPLTHWETERDLRRMIQEEFQSQQISMPYPRRVVIGK